MGDLINVSADPNAVIKADEKMFEMTTSSGAFLPRVQLMTSSSEKCKAGEFPINNFAFIAGQNYKDLGKEVDVLVIHWRPKAVDMSGEVILSSYDGNSDLFQKIMTKADVKDSKCMFGPEFLIYVPGERKFATFFMGSKSARKEAPGIKALLKNACTLKNKKIEWKTYTWFAPFGVPCNTPFELPTNEAIMEELNKFSNPPAQEVEKAEEPAAGGRAR